MRITGTVLAVENETWFKGTKDERAVPQLNCLDLIRNGEPHMKNTFDFTIAREDADIAVESLIGCEVTFLTNKASVSSGGRLSFSGRILRDKLPKGALSAPVPPVSVTTTAHK
jgi:hypothetical protein